MALFLGAPGIVRVRGVVVQIGVDVAVTRMPKADEPLAVAGGDFFKLINEENQFIQYPYFLHYRPQISADLFHSIHHQHAGCNLYVPPGKDAGDRPCKVSFPGTGRAEEEDGLRGNDSMLPGKALPG